MICLPPSGREKSRDRARAKGRRSSRGGYQTTFGQRRLFVRGEMKEGQRARCQRKYAPRVFQNTLANVPGPIDQEITGNDIRASLCSAGRGKRESYSEQTSCFVALQACYFSLGKSISDKLSLFTFFFFFSIDSREYYV